MSVTLDRPVDTGSGVDAGTSRPDGLRHFDSVSLNELRDTAALLTRVDRKYVLPRAALPQLLAGLRDLTKTRRQSAAALEIAGERTFGYRSVYLDTEELRCFQDAGQRRRRRFKVRSRTYLQTGESFLEVKVRGPRGTTVKERIEHPDLEWEPLSDKGIRFIDECLLRYGISASPAQQLRPTLVTAYQRGTLLLDGAGRGIGRVTIDTELAWTTCRGQRRDLDRPGLSIVETKTGSTPTAMDHLLWRSGYRPVQVSKYGTGLAALEPGLPDLRWHRVIAHHLVQRGDRIRPLPIHEQRDIRPPFFPETLGAQDD